MVINYSREKRGGNSLVCAMSKHPYGKVYNFWEEPLIIPSPSKGLGLARCQLTWASGLEA